MIVCHVSKGGAYKVAQHYANVLQMLLLVRPSIKEFTTKLKEDKTNNPIIFNSPHQAFKYLWIIKLIKPKKKVFCVEHFVITQLLKHEFTGISRVLYNLLMKVNDRMGIIPISLDSYSYTCRKRFLGNSKGLIIHNPIVYNQPSCKILKTKTPREFDVIWVGGLSKQKLWPEALGHLSTLSKTSPNLKIAIASYDTPSQEQLDVMSANNIAFLGNVVDWYEKASTLFFSSLYEGYPLVLLESIKNNMNIIAWCNRSCYLQIGKFYENFSWSSSAFDFCWPDWEPYQYQMIHDCSAIELSSRHSEKNFKKELLQL